MRFFLRCTQRLESVLAHIPIQLQAVVILILMAAGNQFLVWWAFLAPAFLAGFLCRRRARPEIRTGRIVALSGALAWVLMAFAQDALSGWRVSPRLSGLFHLPFGIGIYLVIAIIAGFLALLSASLGESARFLLAFSERRRAH